MVSERVILSEQQFNRLDLLLSAIGNALWAINDQLKPLDNAINNQTTEITKWQSLQVQAIETGFTLVTEALKQQGGPDVQQQIDQLTNRVGSQEAALQDAVDRQKGS